MALIGNGEINLEFNDHVSDEETVPIPPPKHVFTSQNACQNQKMFSKIWISKEQVEQQEQPRFGDGMEDDPSLAQAKSFLLFRLFHKQIVRKCSDVCQCSCQIAKNQSKKLKTFFQVEITAGTANTAGTKSSTKSRSGSKKALFLD